ncbi:MAG: fimbrillin family protein [Prevotella sp.]|nr:fimbrillin family protein [Prevotella sp.]
MKKVLIVAASAVIILAGCQKTEVINPIKGEGLAFSTGMGKLTKSQGSASASAKGQRNLEAQDFSVWAYAAFDITNSTVVDKNTYIYDGLANTLVKCTKASEEAVLDNEETTEVNEAKPAVPGTWVTDQEYFWPGTDKDLKFFAVSSAASWLRPEDETCPVTIDKDAPSMTLTGYEVKSTANDDLMVADFVQQNQSDRVVDLTFRHTLSKVEFVFKTVSPTGNETLPTVYVQSLEVSGLYYKGDLSVTKKAGQAGVVWDLQWNIDKTDDATFTDSWTDKVTFPSTVEAAAKADDTALKLSASPVTFATWLIMPQTIEQKTVTIKYVINNRQFTTVFPLYVEDDLEAWVENQHITYTITLAPNVINFTPSVEGWDQYDADKTNGTDADGNNKYDDIEMQN